MRGTTILSLATAAAALAALAGGVIAAPKGRTIWDGVYSEAQATSGAARYAQQCARCHGADLYGTAEIPSLRGQLIQRWGNAPLDGLFGYINKAMPLQAPGALPAAMDAEIVAYMLKVNGAPAGATELSADPAELKKIAIAAKPVGLP